MAVATNTGGDERIDVLALWRVLWRYKVLITATTFVCALIAVALALTATPIYRAEAAVTEVMNSNMGLTSSLANQFGGLASLVGVNLSAGGAGSRESLALLKSRRLVEEFIKRNELQAVMYEKSSQPHTLWFAVERFRLSVLGIREDKRNSTTIIAMSWTDPATASRWANSYVALANEMLRKRAMDESTASVEYLNDKLKTTDVVELRRAMFNLIENETKTLMLANAKTEYAFALVDPAVPPEKRTSPKRMVMVFFGALAGGLIGVIVAFVRNMIASART